MRILVTGSHGTIGRALVKKFRERGDIVWGCDLYHSEDEYGFSLNWPGSYFRCDVGDYRQLERVLKTVHFDFVYHTAAEFGRYNGEDFYEPLWRTNVIGTKNLIRLQEELGFRLIHFSSSEVYGNWPEVMVETVMDTYAIRQLNDYAMTKWVNEMQIHNSGGKTVIVRLFNTYGPGEHYSPYRSVNCRFLYCALKGMPWQVFRGHSRTSTYLADTVATLSAITGNFKPGETYNIGGDTMHTIEELSDTVLKVTGASPSLVYYRESELMATKVKRVDVSKAIRDLGHRNTVSLEEGLKLTADWMRKVYGL